MKHDRQPILLQAGEQVKDLRAKRVDDLVAQIQLDTTTAKFSHAAITLIVDVVLQGVQ
jgi:hypothetical protein